LTPELQAKIEAVLDRNELEDLYIPYKPKRRTKATIARKRAWNRWPNTCGSRNPRQRRSMSMQPPLSAKKRRRLRDEALEGARHIIANRSARRPNTANIFGS